MAFKKQFLYTHRNYWLFLIAVILIVSGYFLMTGTPNAGSNEFNHEIYSFRRITLAPIVVFMGYVVVAFAIMMNPGKHRNQ